MKIKIRNPNENRIELLKSCLFVINMFTQLKEEEKDLVKLRKEIVSYLFVDSNPNYENNTKTLREKQYFINLKKYLEILFKNFQKQQNITIILPIYLIFLENQIIL